jgi:geranylgeranyl pyrophosphate synthase
MRDDLKRYQKIVNKELERLAETIGKKRDPFLNHNYGLLSEYLLRGGKRLRAIACIKSYEAFSGKKEKRILIPAISLELYHAASLVHDDIMDEDDIRRNKASMHKMHQDWFLRQFREKKYNGNIFNKESVRFSASAAIIQGNIMFSLVLRCLTNCDFEEKLKNEALDLIQRSYRKVNDGQLLDMVNEFELDVGEKEYINMAALKTGNLFATSMELGAILAKANKESKRLIHDFGINIAIAFQIQDDIMDVDESMKKGNTLGSDIRKGKMTLLMINALKTASQKQKEYITGVSGMTNATKSEILKVVRIFKETRSIDRAKELAEKYIGRGKSCLKGIKKDISPEGYEFFTKLAEYMTKRVI